MPKYKTLLLPTDFSRDAAVAVEHAIEIAQMTKGRIHLIHVYHFPAYATGGYGRVAGSPAALLAEIRLDAEGQIRDVEKQVSEAGIAVSTELIEGTPSERVVECAEREDADLIVMGTRGLSGLKHVFVGSVAERTIRHAPCPVLTVKADEN